MPDDASEFRIKVAIDTADASTGADQAVDDVGRIKDSLSDAGDKAEETGKKSSKLVEELGGMRESQRVAHDLANILSGEVGTQVEGVTGLVRVLLATSEGFDPLILAFTIVASSLVGIIAKQQEHAEKAKSANKEIGDSTDTLKDQIEQLGRSGETAFQNIGASAKDSAGEIRAETEATKELQKALDEQKSARLAAQVALLDAQEEGAQQGKSPDQQQAIKRDFDARRLNLRQQFEESEAQQKVVDKQQELATKSAELAAKEKEISDQEVQVHTRREAAQQARLGVIGVQSDADEAQRRQRELENKSLDGPLSSSETSELANLRATVMDLVTQEAANGPTFKEQIKNLTARRTDFQESEAESSKAGDTTGAAFAHDQAATITQQLDAIANYEGQMQGLAKVTAESAKAASENQDAVIKLQGDIAALKVQVDTAQLNVGKTAVVDATQQMKLADTQSKSASEEGYKLRQAQREADKHRLETDAKNPSLTPEESAQLKARADQIEVSGYKDRLNNAQELGLTNEEIIKLKGLISDTPKAAAFTVQTAQNGEEKQESSLDNKTARQVGESMEKEIRTLGASKEELMLAHRAVEELGQGNAQGGAILNDLLNKLIGTTKTFTEENRQVAQNIVNRLGQVEKILSDHSRDLKKHSGNIGSLTY